MRAAWPAGVACVAALLCLPFLRTVLWLADEGVWLSGAMRLLHGQVLYRDFFEFTPPGGFFITAAWFWLFGTSIVAARLLAIAAIAGIAVCTYAACARAAGHKPLAAVMAIGWVVATQGWATQVNHHFFTTLFCMAAACFALESVAAPAGRPGKCAAGFLCAGLACMVTPTRGVLLAAALLAGLPGPRRHARTWALCAFAVATAPLAVMAYLISRNALADAYADAIVFPATRYAAIQSVPFGADAGLQNALLLAIYPAAFGLAFVQWLRTGPHLFAAARFRLCAALAAAGLAGSFPRPDIFHLAFTVPMALPLLVGGIEHLRPEQSPRARGLPLAVALAACLPSAAGFARVVAETASWMKVCTPRGKVLFPPGDRDRADMITIISAAPPSARVFFYPYLMMLPYLTDHDQAAPEDEFIPGYTTPAQYRAACRAVMQNATWVVIDRPWMSPGFLTSIYPALRDPNPPERIGLEAAIHEGFALLHSGAEFELFRRRWGIDPPCG
jgi:hypothetical protein